MARYRQDPPAQQSRAERLGSALAHGNALFIGLPIAVTGFLPFSLAFVPCPIVAYLIARTFRRRGLAWGAFQGMQAAVAQLLLFILAFAAAEAEQISYLALGLWTSWFLLFLYTLWGALDSGLGYNFRYRLISNLLEHISTANLSRRERRRRLFGRLEDPAPSNSAASDDEKPAR